MSPMDMAPSAIFTVASTWPYACESEVRWVFQLCTLWQAAGKQKDVTWHGSRVEQDYRLRYSMRPTMSLVSTASFRRTSARIISPTERVLFWQKALPA